MFDSVMLCIAACTSVAADPVVVPMKLDLVKPTIEVAIDGRGPYRFLLDTGASPPLVVNDDLVAELGLPTTPGGRIADAMGVEPIEFVEVPVTQVAIGDAQFGPVTAISWDRSALYSGPDAPRGIVGFSLFHEHLLTLDYPKQQLVIEAGELPAPDGRTILPITLGNGIPAVPITIAGRPFEAHLDSGSMTTIMLPLSEAAALPLVDEPQVVAHGQGARSAFEVYAATLDGQIVFGPRSYASPQIHFVDGFPGANVGSEILAGFRLTFDQRHERVRIEPVAGPGVSAAPKPRRTYGLMVDPRSMPMKVLRVVSGSPAERGGLRDGDVILEINGTAVQDMLVGDIGGAFRQSLITLLVERDGARRTITMSLDPE